MAFLGPEYLPLARRWKYVDGEWIDLRFPLSQGGARDIPPGAIFHYSVVSRLRDNPTYRPANHVWAPGFREPVALRDIYQQAGPDQGHNNGVYQAFFVPHELPDRIRLQTEQDTTYKVQSSAAHGKGRYSEAELRGTVMTTDPATYRKQHFVGPADAMQLRKMATRTSAAVALAGGVSGMVGAGVGA
ncbi:MAG: hypothetical protein LQ340_002944 [Diploschistes diacapsis]|nr:MAG: hypothetical protein LQ340_002944 [Diploschistes diacapsis]